jgi:hypothetical protein
VPLQTRTGIATGLVVVGDLIGSGTSQEQAIVGETPNLAARLQSIAEPNSVVIAESTRRLLGNLFELQDVPAKNLKGIAEPHEFPMNSADIVDDPDRGLVTYRPKATSAAPPFGRSIFAILMPAQSRAIDGEPAMGTAAQTVDRRAWKGEALSVGVCATSQPARRLAPKLLHATQKTLR